MANTLEDSHFSCRKGRGSADLIICHVAAMEDALHRVRGLLAILEVDEEKCFDRLTFILNLLAK